MKALYLFLTVAILAAGCKKGEESKVDQVTVTGMLHAQGFTTYQYGTHTITNASQFYALKSTLVNLDAYLDKNVTLTGNKLNYHVENGPEYLEVTSIKLP